MTPEPKILRSTVRVADFELTMEHAIGRAISPTFEWSPHQPTTADFSSLTERRQFWAEYRLARRRFYQVVANCERRKIALVDDPGDGTGVVEVIAPEPQAVGAGR